MEDPHTEREVWKNWEDYWNERKGKEMIEGKMLIEVCIRDKDFN